MNQTPTQIPLFSQTKEPIIGLTDTQVQEQIHAGQTNFFPIPKRSYWDIVSQNSFNSINIIIFVVGFVLFLMGRWTDSLIYVSVILVNIGVSIYQEIKAKIQLDRITSLVAPTSVVVRNGVEQTINSQNIVLGDTVKISLGDSISVDGIILSGQVQVNEALLTGESDILTKKTKGDEDSFNIHIDDQVFAGSFVVGGSAYILATKVGANSTANQLLSKAKKPKHSLTPIQIEINQIIRVLFLVVALLSALIITGNILNRNPNSDFVVNTISATAVIIAIVPNSLFVMINLAYALGAVKMAKQNVLVQKINAVESISNVDVLCFDKTGTLTSNNIYLDQHILTPKSASQKDLAMEYLGVFTSNCTSTNKTFDALKNWVDSQTNLQTNGSQTNPEKIEIINEVAFGSSHKWSGISFETKIFGTRTLIFGAFEILKNTFEYEFEGQGIDDLVLPYIENGCRVLCFVSSDEILETGDPAPKLPTKTTLEAVLIFKDELRNGVGEMLNQFHEEGVEIKIISGDNPQAVASLFKQVVANSPLSGVSAKFISGLELANLEQGEFAFAVSQNTIFGRITPEQKERIVETLQSMGRFVAMTGDGVNDILSLKKANLGIAMNSGSQATRQLADLVLLDDNLGSLLDVLQEGKRIKASLNNIFQLYLSRSLFLVLIIVYSAIIRLPFPFTIKQSSILAIISTGIPSIGLTLWSQAISENTKNTNPKNINSKNNLGSKLHQSIREFVLPAGISMSLVGVVLYLVVVSFSQQYKMASNPVVAGQTALVVFGAMCCLVLCNVIFTNKKIQILTLWLGIIAVCLPLTRFGAVWNLDTARLLPVGISAVFVLAWMPIFWFGRKIMKG